MSLGNGFQCDECGHHWVVMLKTKRNGGYLPESEWQWLCETCLKEYQKTMKEEPHE